LSLFKSHAKVSHLAVVPSSTEAAAAAAAATVLHAFDKANIYDDESRQGENPVGGTLLINHQIRAPTLKNLLCRMCNC